MYSQLEKSKYRKISTHQKPVPLTGHARQGRLSHNNFVVMPSRQSEPVCNVSSGSAVIQRQTIINYNNVNPHNGNIRRNSVIRRAFHNRVTLRPEERDHAADFSKKRGKICHHHAPYHRIERAIRHNFLDGKRVNQAILLINNAIDQLNQVANGFAPIPHIRFRSFYLMMSEEFDDAIANIANDPRNLFYALRPMGDGGGRQLDWPINQDGENLALNHHMFQYSQILAHNNML